MLGEPATRRRQQHEFPARAPRRHRRSEIAGNPGLSADQGSARIRCGAAGIDLAFRQTRLPDPRRHPDYAAGRGAEDRVRGMRARTIIATLAMLGIFPMAMRASAEETRIRVGAIDAVLAVPSDVERPPVALLIAGSGTTDHDGNGPQIKPATLKKLSEQLAARKIATLRYDKRGAGGVKPEFGRPEDFRFRDYVDDAVALVNYLRDGGKFSKVILVGHSEGGLVAILAARRGPRDPLGLLGPAGP